MVLWLQPLRTAVSKSSWPQRLIDVTFHSLLCFGPSIDRYGPEMIGRQPMKDMNVASPKQEHAVDSVDPP